MNSQGLELKNPFTACKVVAANVDPDAYHRQEPNIKRGDADFVMTRSALMDFRRDGPSKWKATTKPHKDTDATDFGTLQDVRALTPEQFPKRYILTPETCTATKTMKAVKSGKVQAGDAVPWNPTCAEAKEWKEAQADSGMIVLSAEDYADSNEALTRIQNDERIKTLLSVSDKQVLIVGEYHDKATGVIVPVKTLVDLMPGRGTPEPFTKCLADWKTAREAAPEIWPFVVDKRDYDAQAAMSLWLATAAEPVRDWQGWLHCGHENTHPFEPFRRWLSAEMIELGRVKILSALERYCACLSSGQWPAWDDAGRQWPGLEGWGICEPTNKALMRTEPAEPMIFSNARRETMPDDGHGITP